VDQESQIISALLSDFDLAYDAPLHTTAFHSHSGIGAPSRYLPDDIAHAGADEKPALLKRPGNDLYALCQIMFDLFAGHRTGVPSPPTYENILAKFTSPEHQDNRARRLRQKVAAICAKGLQLDADARYPNIAELSKDWTRRPKALMRVGLVVELLWLGAVVLAVDALTHSRHLASATQDTLSALPVLLTVLVPLLLVYLPLSPKKTLALWAARLERLCSTRLRTYALVASSLALSGFAYDQTDLGNRLDEYRVVSLSGGECVERGAPKVTLGRNSVVHRRGTRGVNCTKGTQLEVVGQTWFSWQKLPVEFSLPETTAEQTSPPPMDEKKLVAIIREQLDEALTRQKQLEKELAEKKSPTVKPNAHWGAGANPPRVARSTPVAAVAQSSPTLKDVRPTTPSNPTSSNKAAELARADRDGQDLQAELESERQRAQSLDQQLKEIQAHRLPPVAPPKVDYVKKCEVRIPSLLRDTVGDEEMQQMNAWCQNGAQKITFEFAVWECECRMMASPTRI
jgi:hypothetical protein